ncbi:exopolygalacturonase X [Colletotrichum truncatum]|uniref:Exopolygalacturonase X n=1 Tax=Colletotrichum truncatum TaxID=5467 RepID=A0ACC3YWM8_COLTU|nr:exopolygalacturonase X [Colletotrichum truncatum]KAF6787456.1 exopolygalacturonase X [Colletotrichum truncatum]
MVSGSLFAVAALALSGVAQAREVPPRPDTKAHPNPPFRPFPVSPPRTKSCFVKPSCTPGRDDSAKILKAFHDCNNGGTVVLDESYTICTPLDLRFLKHVDVALTGRITFCDGVDDWMKKFFPIPFQEGNTWWLWGGEDINLYGLGKGVIDGNGQEWYDAHGSREGILRPLLFVTDGWKGGSITGLKMRQSPNWHNLIANSSDILVSDFDIYSRSASKYEAKNLDGWDTYRSSNIVIQNSVLDHDDDCVSFKPNSTEIIVQGLQCNSSHGISVGSLAQYPGVVDIIENLYIFNNTLSNATDSARLKVWPGLGAVTKPGWIGGGGIGHVRNVTYEQFHVRNNDAALKIDQCYGAVNASTCKEHPSQVLLENILFKDFDGYTSKASDPVAGALICSSEESCDNIRAENVRITVPSGKTTRWQVRNVEKELLDVNGEIVQA